MRAGLLDKVITIQEPTVLQNSYGGNSVSWSDFITTRAQVTYSNGNRVNENNEIIFSYEIVFTIRIYHAITERMRILWNGKKYRILSIEEDTHLQRMIVRTELINE